VKKSGKPAKKRKAVSDEEEDAIQIISTKDATDDDVSYKMKETYKTRDAIWNTEKTSQKPKPSYTTSTDSYTRSTIQSISGTLATASRIRELEAQLDNYHKLERNYATLKEDHSHLRRQYHELEQRVMSKANTVFDEYKFQAEQKYQHAEQRIRALEQENLALQSDVKKAQQGVASSAPIIGLGKQETIQLIKDKEALEAENEMLKADGTFLLLVRLLVTNAIVVDGLERRVQFYEEVTATVVNDIAIDQHDQETWGCTTLTDRGRTFLLELC